VTGSVLWDSSAILALLDADDADHATAVHVARRIAAEKRPCFITNYIEVETHALLVRKLGRAIAREWLLAGGMGVVIASQDEERSARAIIALYADRDWTLCDAISLALLDARRVRRAFTFGRHFQQYGRFEVLGLTD
jgi:predicted nucleic acid-binding protein